MDLDQNEKNTCYRFNLTGFVVFLSSSNWSVIFLSSTPKGTQSWITCDIRYKPFSKVNLTFHQLHQWSRTYSDAVIINHHLNWLFVRCVKNPYSRKLSIPCTESDICDGVNIPLEILPGHPSCLEPAPHSLSLKIFCCIVFQKLHLCLCLQDLLEFCFRSFLCLYELSKDLNKLWTAPARWSFWGSEYRGEVQFLTARVSSFRRFVCMWCVRVSPTQAGRFDNTFSYNISIEVLFCLYNQSCFSYFALN